MKKVFAVLLIAVCALSFVCFKQQKEINSLKDTVSSLSSKCGGLKHDISNLESNQHDLDARISDLFSLIDDVSADVSNVRSDIEFKERMDILYGSKSPVQFP